jgi:hypothetical protein
MADLLNEDMVPKVTVRLNERIMNGVVVNDICRLE